MGVVAWWVGHRFLKGQDRSCNHMTEAFFLQASIHMHKVTGFMACSYGHQLAFFIPPWVSLVDASGLLVAAHSRSACPNLLSTRDWSCRERFFCGPEDMLYVAYIPCMRRWGFAHLHGSVSGMLQTGDGLRLGDPYSRQGPLLQMVNFGTLVGRWERDRDLSTHPYTYSYFPKVLIIASVIFQQIICAYCHYITFLDCVHFLQDPLPHKDSFFPQGWFLQLCCFLPAEPGLAP